MIHIVYNHFLTVVSVSSISVGGSITVTHSRGDGSGLDDGGSGIGGGGVGKGSVDGRGSVGYGSGNSGLDDGSSISGRGGVGYRGGNGDGSLDGDLVGVGI